MYMDMDDLWSLVCELLLAVTYDMDGNSSVYRYHGFPPNALVLLIKKVKVMVIVFILV